MYKKMSLFGILFSIIFVGCFSAYTSFNYSKNDEIVKFKFSKETDSLDYKVQDSKYRNKFAGCVFNAFTVETKSMNSKLMIEHISINTDCTWLGLPRSIYTDFIRDEIKVKRVELIDRTKVNEYEFSIYKTDKNCIMYLITISQMYDTTFIVDNTGNFYNDLLLKVKPDHKIKDFSNYCRVDFNSSLMDNAGFGKTYFAKDSNGRMRMRN